MKKVFFSVFFGINLLLAATQTATHTVLKGETLYSIAKQYHSDVHEIARLNNFSTQYGVRIGQRLLVPAQAPVAKPITLGSAKPVPAKVHTITRGETLYAVCKKYGVSISEIKQWNHLVDLTVHPGQRLIVSKANAVALYNPVAVPSTPDTPYREEDVRPRAELVQTIARQDAIVEPALEKPVVEKPEPAPVVYSLKTTSSNAAEYPGIFNQYPTRGYKIKRMRGAANYLPEATSGNQHLAFYNDAETGSIIRVTNLMNHKTIFVKVVGKVPPSDASNEIVIKLAHKAAQDLGVQDEKFLAEIAAYSAN